MCEDVAFAVELNLHDLVVTCKGPEAVVVGSVRMMQVTHQLNVPLLPGCRLSLRRPTDAPVELQVSITRQIDLVCPRPLASIFFSADEKFSARRSWAGIAPESENQAGS